jgi:regulator of sigma E protease
LMVESTSGRDLPVLVRDAAGQERQRVIDGARLADLSEDAGVLTRLGLVARRPPLAPVIGRVVPGEAAEQAGLLAGDRLLSADGEPISDWAQWVAMVQSKPGQELRVRVERASEILTIAVTPRAVESPPAQPPKQSGQQPERQSAQQNGAPRGRIGAEVRVDRVYVRHGPLQALDEAWIKTRDMSWLTVRVIGRMLVGQASVQNLSGPITIAKAAGQTASNGLDAFVKFLAVVSISLGVLNLLPIPILDGGHLLYFLVEGIKGSPLSEHAQLQGQKVGIVLLAALMGLAFFVDLSRIFG